MMTPLVLISQLPAAGTDLRVSSSGRYLEEADGAPFLWLGDTGWGLIARLNREDTELYLSDRQANGINVIQAVVHWRSSYGGTGNGPRLMNTRNAYGHSIFNGAEADPDTSSPKVVAGGTPDAPTDYWDHVDFVVREARERGMHLALLPTWAAEFINGPAGKLQYDEASARAYGEFLGARYADEPHIIWTLGGDIDPHTNGDKRGIYRAMAEGIAKGVSGQKVSWDTPDPAWDTVLITWHSPRYYSSGTWFHDEAWLDFNMYQTGQVDLDQPVPVTSADYARTPAKPTVNGESTYEGFTSWSAKSPENTALTVRRTIYQSFLSGACGYTYGGGSSAAKSGDELWAFGDGPAEGSGAWKKRLALEGANDLRHVRTVLALRNWQKQIPAPEVIISGAGTGATRKVASRSMNNDGLLVYYPENTAAVIKNTLPVEARARWFNVSNGSFEGAGTFLPSQKRSLQPPEGWADAALVIEANP